MLKEYASIEEFAKQNNTNTIIKRILIANNGNAALKFAKSIKEWCLQVFNNENEIELVGLVTCEDESGSAEYISFLDFVARLPGGSNNFNYANIDEIVKVANAFECDGVWPGWGHASENDELPRALSSRSNALWIGPSAESMVAVGCKIASTIVAQNHNVPVVKWSGSRVKLEKKKDGTGFEEITQSHIQDACIKSVNDLVTLLENNMIDVPFMLKAAAGGGGKGIRIVNNIEDAEDAYRQVCNEVQGSLIFAMNCLSNCRHIEVQILGDNYGNVLPCGTRDCTIQRRHQKIIEEGPPICLDEKTKNEVMEAAKTLCEAVHYKNAGTVEFLYDNETSKFYFLEVNARLQVEHVVTELLMDANLPAAQVQITMGLELDKIDTLTKYIEEKKNNLINKKHCIAARIVAENPEKNFQPTTGKIHELHMNGSPNVWGYFSIGQGGTVHQYCDSQIGHIFCVADNREQARKYLVRALHQLTIRGEISVNISALLVILNHEDYIANKTWTKWLEDKNICRVQQITDVCSISPTFFNAVLYGATYKAITEFRNNEEEFKAKINQGQVPGKLLESVQCTLLYQGALKFITSCYQSSNNTIKVTLNGSEATVRYNESSTQLDKKISWFFMSEGIDFKHRKVGFQENTDIGELKVEVDHQTYCFSKEQDPTQFCATYSAKLVRWLVENGSYVEKGTNIAEIELMKMYLPLSSEISGTITILQSEGVVFQPGVLLATFEPPAHVVVKKPTVYSGTFAEVLKNTTSVNLNKHHPIVC
uniref:biotin carboxylase n=1 Tax=Dermatophagoides pteronyssinus TaxID=6956 RepID=A0A6P6YD62_DERPT|nr:acetyl-CoA carboxylase-like [Dermatophagoides pteronyssinus]